MIICKTAVSWGTWLANLRSLGSCVLETQHTPLKQHASLLTFEMAVDHPIICLPASFFHQMFQQSTRKTHEGWIIHKSLQIVRLAIRDQCSWLWDLEIITKHAWLHALGKGHNCSNHKNKNRKIQTQFEAHYEACLAPLPEPLPSNVLCTTVLFPAHLLACQLCFSSGGSGTES